MKLKYLAVTMLAGMLAAAPAYAFPNGTHGHNYKFATQPVASQAKPEVQVAVMAQSPSQPADARTDIKALCPTVSIWYGSGSSARATHSR
jgi:hypothetical protein